MPIDPPSARKALSLLELREPGVFCGITPSLGGVYSEAAAVCLEDQGHDLHIELEVSGLLEAKYNLTRPSVTDDMRRSHNDLQRATENGAHGIAILLVRDVTGCGAFCQAAKTGRRSTRELERGIRQTGFDHWVGSVDGKLFQDKVRLEVSGILNGTKSQIRDRLKSKKAQIRVSDDTGLPGYAIVAEFSRPVALIAKR